MAKTITKPAKGVTKKAVKGTTNKTTDRVIRKTAEPIPAIEVGDEVNVYNYQKHVKLEGRVLLVYEDMRIDVLILIPGQEHQSEGHVNHISKSGDPSDLFWDK
jgi:hypothetical protein